MKYALQDIYKCSSFSRCVAILCVYDERRTRCKSHGTCYDIPIWLKNEVSSHSYIGHWYTQINTLLKMWTYPTHPDYYSLVIKLNILGFSKFLYFNIRFCCNRLSVYTHDRSCINCIMCLLYCASDVNLNFYDVFDHMPAYLLQ